MSLFGVFPRNLGEGIWVAYLRKLTRSDKVTRNALAARNNEAYGQGNGRQSLSAVFKLELKMDYPSETGLQCTVAPSPTDTPSPIFF